MMVYVWTHGTEACCDDEDLEDVTEYIEVLRAAKECTKSWLKGS